MKTYKRIDSIPPYSFSELDKLKNALVKDGRDIIDLSIGDPDLPTPDFVVDALKVGAVDKAYFRYPPFGGTGEYKRAVSDYYKRRFNVELDEANEIIALVGSKEGIAHLSLTLVDQGDTVIIPEPSYPIYRSSVYLAGGKPFILKLSKSNDFLPQLSQIDEETVKNTKLIYVNYPNNPTGAICSVNYFKYLVEFAVHHNIVIVNDAAYNEIIYDGRPVSIMEVKGARDNVLEIGTLSKSYNMTGWRIGYAVGSKDVLKKLSIIKSNIDSGQFGAIQHAAATALNSGDQYILYLKGIYKHRRDLALKVLQDAGIEFAVPKGSFYIWYKIPQNMESSMYSYRLAVESGVMVTPGIAFGMSGEGYCRLSLTAHESQIKMALDRIALSFMKI